jgi:hypothetical protein
MGGAASGAGSWAGAGRQDRAVLVLSLLLYPNLLNYILNMPLSAVEEIRSSVG